MTACPRPGRRSTSRLREEGRELEECAATQVPALAGDILRLLRGAATSDAREAIKIVDLCLETASTVGEFREPVGDEGWIGLLWVSPRGVETLLSHARAEAES